MRIRHYIAAALFLAGTPSLASSASTKTVDVPCLKNLADGRVLVDGALWDAKMRELGYRLADGAYVPYRVLRFRQTRVHDTIWADGECRMELLPETK